MKYETIVWCHAWCFFIPCCLAWLGLDDVVPIKPWSVVWAQLSTQWRSSSMWFRTPLLVLHNTRFVFHRCRYVIYPTCYLTSYQKHRTWFYNRPISQSSHCTCPISHNTPFRTEMGTWHLWDLWDWSIDADRLCKIPLTVHLEMYRVPLTGYIVYIHWPHRPLSCNSPPPILYFYGNFLLWSISECQKQYRGAHATTGGQPREVLTGTLHVRSLQHG